MAFPVTLVGTACVVLTHGWIGTYDQDGQCVVRFGSAHARPAEQFDLDAKPKDQHGTLTPTEGEEKP